jgi:hypothetical protein
MKAKLDKQKYKKGKNGTGKKVDNCNIEYDKISSECNYVIKPRKKTASKK